MTNSTTDKKSKRKGKITMIIVIIAAALVLTVLIILPPSTGKISNRNNDEICEKTFLDINGTRLGMVIKGAKAENPVLLVMGGGPGIPEYLLEAEYPTDIDKYFTVCYPCYRGTALSYDPELPEVTMTVDQMVDDAVCITDYLRERFGKEKIYLMSHSFGTEVALPLASKYPEKYEAYIGMSMVTDQERSEKKAFTYMLEWYKNEGNKSMTEELEQYADLFTDEAVLDMSNERLHAYFAKTRDKAMHETGVGTCHDMKSVITDIFFASLRMTEFTPTERINIWRGKIFASNTKTSSEDYAYNAFDVVDRLEIPFYVFAGKYDMTTDYSMQREYFKSVSAETKGFYTFEDSAHSPLFEEPEKAAEILLGDVLAGKTDLADRDI